MSWLKGALNTLSSSNFFDVNAPEGIAKFKELVSKVDDDSIDRCNSYFKIDIVSLERKDFSKYGLSKYVAELISANVNYIQKCLLKPDQFKKEIDFFTETLAVIDLVKNVDQYYSELIHFIINTNNEEYLKISIGFIRQTLVAPALIGAFFKNENLSIIWIDTFMKNDVANIVIGPTVIECSKLIRFSKVEYLQNFFKVSLDYLSYNKIEDNLLVNPIMFISCIISHTEELEYFEQLLKVIFNLAHKIHDVSMFEEFLKIKTDHRLTWTVLSRIAEQNSLPILNHILKIISTGAGCPQVGSFDFSPFAKNMKSFNDTQKSLIYQIVANEIVQTKFQFLVASQEFQETGADLSELANIAINTIWGNFLDSLIEQFITKQRMEYIINLLETNENYLRIIISICNQINETNDTREFLKYILTIAETKPEVVPLILSRIIERCNLVANIGIIMEEIENGLNTIALDIFSKSARKLSIFNPTFLSRNCDKIFPRLLESDGGLNLLSALSIDGPFEIINNFVEENIDKFKKLPLDKIRSLLFAQPLGFAKEGLIRIPPLIKLLDDVSMSNPYNMMVVSQQIEHNKETIPKFMIQSISHSDAKIVFSDPNLLLEASNPKYPHTDFVLFHESARNCKATSSLPSSLTFWVFPFGLTGRSVIASFSNKEIILNGEELDVFGLSKLKFEANTWHQISISKKMGLIDSKATVIIDGVKFDSININSMDPIRFGSSDDTLTWMLSTHCDLRASKEGEGSYHMSQYTGNLELQCDTGPRFATYSGILRHLKSFGGAEFVFQRILNCNKDDFFIYIQIAFNLLKLKAIEELKFFRLLRYTIYMRRDLYDTEISDKIMEIAKDTNFFSCFIDYRILSSSKFGFNFVPSMIHNDLSSQRADSFFNFAINTFIFFDLTDDAEARCLMLLEAVIAAQPRLIERLMIAVQALPFIETDQLKDTFCDETKLDKQKKLCQLIKRNQSAVLSISPSCLTRMITTVSNDIVLSMLELYATLCIDSPSYFSILEIKRMIPTLSKLTESEQLWVSLFTMMTSNKLSIISDYAGLPIARTELIPVIIKLCSQTVTSETDVLCTAIVQILFGMIVSSGQSLYELIKQISSLCSLGFNHNQSTKVEISTINRLRRRRSSSIPAEHMMAHELMALDKNLYDATCEYISLTSDKIISEQQSVSENPKEFSEDIFNLSSVELIVTMTVKILTETATDDVSKFKRSLIYLTVMGGDVDERVSIKMHKRILKEFLSTDFSITNEGRAFLAEFLIGRMADGWWQGQTSSLLELALPILAAKSLPDFSIACLLMEQDRDEVIKSTTLLIKSKIFGSIVADHEAFYTFLLLLAKKDISETNTLLASVLNKTPLTDALSEGKLKDFLEDKAKNEVMEKSKVFIKKLNETANENINFVNKERQAITHQQNDQKLSLYHTNRRVRQCLVRRAYRFQFFVSFDTCAYAIGNAAITLFKYRASKRFATETPEKWMVSSPPSPLCPPVKLFPMVINYEADYVKKHTPIKFPNSKHEQEFHSPIEEITKDVIAPKCLEGVGLSSFSGIALSTVAKMFYGNVLPLSKGIILQTPEALPCVLIFSKSKLHIIINSTLDEEGNMILKDSSDMVCHAALLESSPFGLSLESSLFITHTVLSVSYSDISLIIPRLFVHFNRAVDIYTFEGGSTTIVLGEAEKKFLLKKAKLELKPSLIRGPLMIAKLMQLNVDEVSKLWSERQISSFDYLLYLNAVGGRSFNDYSQYPVFPWVIADYKTDGGCAVIRDLSKPLGAIGEQRKQRYITMYEETGDRYFYGTHYSYPASVFHFLMRVEPYTLYNVNLHNGFDHKDRLFCSVEESYRSASEANQADLKEALPQFFCMDEYLENINSLPLAKRTDGKDLSNVRLPPWARTPREFMYMNRRALESSATSQALPDWIDLVFGYKQRGQAAVDAMNVFHPLTYEDVLPESGGDPSKYKGEVDAINNFGQCPHQLFTNPHIRFGGRKKASLSGETNVASLKTFAPGSRSIEVIEGRIIATPSFIHVIDGNVLRVSDGCISFGSTVLCSDSLYGVVATELSKDHLLLATASAVGVVSIFRIIYGQIEEVRTCIVPDAAFTAVAISSFLETVVAATDEMLYSIDISSGFVNRKRRLEKVTRLAIDDVSFLIVAGCEDRAVVLSVNLDEVSKSDSPTITALALADGIVWSDAPSFVTGHRDGSVALWTVGIADGALSSRPLAKVLNKEVVGLAVFNEGGAAVAADADGTAVVISGAIQVSRVLSAPFFNGCPYCMQALDNPAVCRICGLPVCSGCMNEEGICSVCKAKIQAMHK